jgi:hypothetical protein
MLIWPSFLQESPGNGLAEHVAGGRGRGREGGQCPPPGAFHQVESLEQAVSMPRARMSALRTSRSRCCPCSRG